MQMDNVGGDACPSCGSSTSFLVDWEFSGLGDSVFNYTANFFACSACGQVYVRNVDDATLARFYTEECSYFEKPHFAVTSPENQEKYAFYSHFLREHGIDSVDMADVGCGRGGFVNWLGEGGWNGACWGVDVDIRSMPQGAAGKVAFKSGGVLNLPFADNSLELLTYFHVLEHIRDLHGLLKEAGRVLQPDGHILIEVPDAENYATLPIGPAFWISIREHINHFTARALAEALQACGFSVVTVSRQTLPTPEFVYPSLMILARKIESQTPAELPPAGNVARFVLESKYALAHQAREIAVLAKDKRISIWGCSAELFSLLPMLDLPEIRICDSSKLKQSARYKGLAIEEPAALPIEGMLVVAPYLHREAIKKAALGLGWPEESIYVLH